jgi:hypothetical protein
MKVREIPSRKREGADPQARLAFHQERSGLIMAALEAWLSS